MKQLAPQWGGSSEKPAKSRRSLEPSAMRESIVERAAPTRAAQGISGQRPALPDPALRIPEGPAEPWDAMAGLVCTFSGCAGLRAPAVRQRLHESDLRMSEVRNLVAHWQQRPCPYLSGTDPFQTLSLWLPSCTLAATGRLCAWARMPKTICLRSGRRCLEWP